VNQKLDNKRGLNGTGQSFHSKNLYIYVMDGNLKEEAERKFGPGFIGNWVEGDSSFLFFSKPPDKEIEILLRSDKDLALSDRFHFYL